MKAALFLFVILAGLSLVRASDEVNLITFGSFEESFDSTSLAGPAGWRVMGGTVELESDAAERLSGERSLKLRTAEGSRVLISDNILVEPDTEYEVQVSILARGDKPAYRPFVGLAIGGKGERFPAEEDTFLAKWDSKDEEVGFVTKKARFVTNNKTNRVAVLLIIQPDPAGYVNVDDVILKEVSPTD